MSGLITIRGVAFWSPWSDAVLKPVPPGASAPCRKDVDNRPRPAPGSFRHERGYVALYAAKTIDQAGMRYLADVMGYPTRPDAYGPGWAPVDLYSATAPGCIVGVARYAGTLDPHPNAQPGERAWEPRAWCFGAEHNGKPNFGWVLAEAMALPEPIPCKHPCPRGVFLLPLKVEERVRAFLRDQGSAVTL